MRLCVPAASAKEGILEMEVTEFLILVNCNVALHFFFLISFICEIRYVVLKENSRNFFFLLRGL